MKKHNVFRLAMVLFAIIGLLVTTSVIAAEKGGPETIQGHLEKGQKGITMIKTDDGQTFTILNKNMADMIGKKVKVTGMVTKGTKNHSVIVTSFEEVKD